MNLNRYLHNERVVKSFDPADDWERREAQRAKNVAEEICQLCGEEKAWDEKTCEDCKKIQKEDEE